VDPLKVGAAGAEYFLTIVDVYTHMTWVYVLSKKSNVAETVKTDWLPMVERQQDRLVKSIRTDRGGEFLRKEFGLWLKKNGITHSLTMPYSPAMNGIAKRANRTITETARGLLIEAGLPDYFWPDAVRSACVAKNRALTHVGADKWVPYVEWIGRKPKLDMLQAPQSFLVWELQLPLSLVPAFVAGLGATSPSAQLSFTLDSGVSGCFFRDFINLTPLHTPVTFALADPSVGSVVAHSTTILLCPAATSGFLTGYYTPSFSRNLVGFSHLHDLGVVTTFPLDEPTASSTVGATRVPLATFHKEPNSESLDPHPRSPAPPCTPCVEGRQCAAPHLSSFPPTTAPLQTLHLDDWGLSPVRGPRHERYFLIVVDDYSRNTTVFPLRQKADVPTISELWLLPRGDAQALCGLCLHSDRG
ncbi:unnamed protein product, partial [Closterium sp. NIES-54]